MLTRDTPEQLRLKRIVAEAKALGTYSAINWDDFIWDVAKYEKPYAHLKIRRLALHFSARRKDSAQSPEPYEQPFADFAKAIIRTRASERNLSFDGHTHVMIALRYLYDALRQTGTTDPTHLIRKHFMLAVTDARKKAKGWTIYHVGKALRQIAFWMEERELTRAPLHFTNPIPHPGHGDGLDAESQAQGLLKLPSKSALDALADISNNPVDDNERILMRIVDLLAVGGFRIGEVLSLPVDCWVEAAAIDDVGKVKTGTSAAKPIVRYGIRYWPEKGGDPYLKWLPDAAVFLAQRAVEDLSRLCRRAREAAKLLEKFPDRVPLPEAKSRDTVDRKDLIQILNLKSPGSVYSFLKKIGLEPCSRNKPNGKFAYIYRVIDVERALLKRRHAIVIVRRPGGKTQMLSESLCVMFRSQFNPLLPNQEFLPELIGEIQINRALGNRADEVSVFSIRGLDEPDGSRMRIKTSAFRHWLNTLLARGGLSDAELARWSGRRNIDQNAAYKHGTVEQRVSWARNMIKEGTLRGPAADTYNSINDPVEKEQFLETFVNVALFTPYGVCIHDYAIDPCPYHLNCLGGCSEYLRTKGDKDEQKSIEDVRGFHLVQLQRLKSATQNDAGPVRNYEAHCERIVQGATAALAVDEANIPDGQHVKVFPNGNVRGKAVTSL
jgi:hypothetical protein